MLKTSNPKSNSLTSTLKLAAILAAGVALTGCISAKSKPTESAAAAATPAVVEPATPAPAPAPVAASEPVQPPKQLTQWTVVAGNHLWGIAGIWEVFNVPEKWPLIYKANLDQIRDADLIFPGQVLDIPRDSSVAEIDAAIYHAKNRGAWALGPVELSDKEYLKTSP